MATRAIVQLLASLNPGDAISDFARDLAAAARGLGSAAPLVASRVHPACRGEAASARTTRPDAVAGPGDLLLYHHSIGAGLVDWVRDFPGPRVVVHHSVTPPRFFAGWSPSLARAARAGEQELVALARLTSRAVGVSEHDAIEARTAGFREVRVWPLAPSARRLAAAPRARELARLGAEPGPRLLTVGRVAPNKRVEVLVAAHYLVTRALPQARLRLVGGDGGTEGYALALRQLVRDLGAPNVVFDGTIDDRGLAARYRTADLFLLASEHEGCGLPVLEAMHHRVPVIARAAAAIPETAGGAAWLLDDDRPERWARAIVDLWADSAARARLVADGARQAATRAAVDLGSWLASLD